MTLQGYLPNMWFPSVKVLGPAMTLQGYLPNMWGREFQVIERGLDGKGRVLVEKCNQSEKITSL